MTDAAPDNYCKSRPGVTQILGDVKHRHRAALDVRGAMNPVAMVCPTHPPAYISLSLSSWHQVGNSLARLVSTIPVFNMTNCNLEKFCVEIERGPGAW